VKGIVLPVGKYRAAVELVLSTARHRLRQGRHGDRQRNHQNKKSCGNHGLAPGWGPRTIARCRRGRYWTLGLLRQACGLRGEHLDVVHPYVWVEPPLRRWRTGLVDAPAAIAQRPHQLVARGGDEVHMDAGMPA